MRPQTPCPHLGVVCSVTYPDITYEGVGLVEGVGARRVVDGMHKWGRLHRSLEDHLPSHNIITVPTTRLSTQQPGIYNPVIRRWLVPGLHNPRYWADNRVVTPIHVRTSFLGLGFF